jgi:hypothetical protein
MSKSLIPTCSRSALLFAFSPPHELTLPSSSSVRAQLLPSITPTVLPVVCYTGQVQQEAGNLIQNTRELNRIPAYNKRTHDTDTYATHVGDDRAMIFNYQALDWVHARIQWIYLRKPKGFVAEPVEGAEGGELVARVQEGAEEDALWKPSRRLDQARDIPAELWVHAVVCYLPLFSFPSSADRLLPSPLPFRPATTRSTR